MKHSLVKLTRPGYKSFSRSLSPVGGVGPPTAGAADANDAFAVVGLGIGDSSADTFLLWVWGSNGVAVLGFVITSN